MNETKGIWIFVETENGVINPTIFELLTKARQLKKELCDQDGISAIVLSDAVSNEMTHELFSYGADRVIAVRDSLLAEYNCRIYQNALSNLAKKYSPSILLFAASEMGRELAPLVMWELQTGLTADAIDLLVDTDGMFVQTTPAYGGKINAHIAIPVSRPQMVTVHAQVFESELIPDAVDGEVIYEQMDIEPDNSVVRLSKSIRVKNNNDISSADTLIAGGRGISKKEDLDLLNDLAKLLNGSVACSRPLADCGWMPHDNQIGQSGKTVKPKLIINVGISGSTQYISGMKNADCIISINTDPNAQIFEVSDVAIVGDYKEILTELINTINNSMKGVLI